MKNVCETPEEHEGVIKAALAAMPSDDAIGGAVQGDKRAFASQNSARALRG